jgi:hypothetical protein
MARAAQCRCARPWRHDPPLYQLDLDSKFRFEVPSMRVGLCWFGVNVTVYYLARLDPLDPLELERPLSLFTAPPPAVAPDMPPPV